MVLLPVSLAMRFQVRSVVGPATTVPSMGWPRFATVSVDAVGSMAKGAELGLQPSPLQAATTTLADPGGTGSVTEGLEICRAATVRAPPPGPAGGGCTTWIWYRSAPGTADQLQLALLPVTVQPRPEGALAGTAPKVTVKSTGFEKDPQPAWQARTRMRYDPLRKLNTVEVEGSGTLMFSSVVSSLSRVTTTS